MPGPHFDQGLYQCRVVAQGFDESSQKKTPFFWLAFEPLYVTDGNGERLGECVNWERDVRLYLHENTIDQTVERLRGLGWDGATWKDLEPQGAYSFVGDEITVRCSHEQNGENIYERWELPGEGRPRAENRSGLAKRLDALYGKALKGTAKKPKPAKKKATKPAQRPVVDHDDEIPF